MQKYASNTLDNSVKSVLFVYIYAYNTSFWRCYLRNLQKMYTLTIFRNCIERPNFVYRLWPLYIFLQIYKLTHWCTCIELRIFTFPYFSFSSSSWPWVKKSCGLKNILNPYRVMVCCMSSCKQKNVVSKLMCNRTSIMNIFICIYIFPSYFRLDFFVKWQKL